MGGSSDEGVFLQSQDDKMTLGFSLRDMLPVEAPESVNGSASLDEPYVGQEFDSESDAHAFYNSYATRIGFIIRVSKLSRSRRDGSAIGRALVCNKEGFRMPDKREKIVRQRVETRVGCRAMILVRKVTSGKWVVTKFVKEHTHQLIPGKGRRDLICEQYPDYRDLGCRWDEEVLQYVVIDGGKLGGFFQLCREGERNNLVYVKRRNEHDKIRELTQQLAIEKKRATMYKRHLEMVFEYIEEHNQSLSEKIQVIVDSVKEIESEEQLIHR